MRLASLRSKSGPFIGARRDGAYVDLNAALPSLEHRDVGALLRSGTFDARALAAAAASAHAPVNAAELGGVTYDPPLAAATKVICLGLNYIDHAAESEHAKPDFPVIFNRFVTSFVGHGQGLLLPPESHQFDYESELVVVIGRRGRRVPRERALEHVAGYTLMNDGSIRDYQLRTPQWTLGKNFDASGSIGPELVTADELPPGARGLRLEGRLNGTVMQAASTSDMIFDVETTIAFVSLAITLEPGDLIAMGTPSGVGFARKPPVFLRPGDVFEVEVERVGTLRNPIVSETDAP
ncbi:MAG: fumarylacetoacetate hydrolase family protein [Polyangiaceae bacterium]|jgi:2-keto-4-pentenoate hydratase/2-oxohepta-3-ene-1,7-dioic acid hydratase in catechol pathway|nr:fumarylacetoacetate hydrolase family protein [Polyangiaceae bacterium]